MKGRAAKHRAGYTRWAIVIVLLLIVGFVLQAAIGYYLLYRSYVFDKPSANAGFLRWVATEVEADQQPRYGYYSPQGGQIQAMWSAEAKFFSGVVRADARFGGQTQTDYWGGFVYYHMPNDIDRFRRLVPRSCDRFLIKRDADGDLKPNTPRNTRVAYVACGWPMVSLAGIDTNTGTAAGDAWRASGAHVIEVQRQSIAGPRTERIVIPLRPLMIGTLVNTLIFSAMLGFLLLLASGGRRLWRYERGRCPRCAYDLRRDFQSGCSECGWARHA